MSKVVEGCGHSQGQPGTRSFQCGHYREVLREVESRTAGHPGQRSQDSLVALSLRAGPARRACHRHLDSVAHLRVPLILRTFYVACRVLV
jgi:hypothetical protein